MPYKRSMCILRRFSGVLEEEDLGTEAISVVMLDGGSESERQRRLPPQRPPPPPPMQQPPPLRRVGFGRLAPATPDDEAGAAEASSPPAEPLHPWWRMASRSPLDGKEQKSSIKLSWK